MQTQKGHVLPWLNKTNPLSGRNEDSNLDKLRKWDNG